MLYKIIVQPQFSLSLIHRSGSCGCILYTYSGSVIIPASTDSQAQLVAKLEMSSVWGVGPAYPHSLDSNDVSLVKGFSAACPKEGNLFFTMRNGSEFEAGAGVSVRSVTGNPRQFPTAKNSTEVLSNAVSRENSDVPEIPPAMGDAIVTLPAVYCQ